MHVHVCACPWPAKCWPSFPALGWQCLHAADGRTEAHSHNCKHTQTIPAPSIFSFYVCICRCVCWPWLRALFLTILRQALVTRKRIFSSIFIENPLSHTDQTQFFLKTERKSLYCSSWWRLCFVWTFCLFILSDSWSAGIWDEMISLQNNDVIPDLTLFSWLRVGGYMYVYVFFFLFIVELLA